MTKRRRIAKKAVREDERKSTRTQTGKSQGGRRRKSPRQALNEWDELAFKTSEEVVQTVWLSPTGYVTGDPELKITYPFLLTPSTVVTSASTGDLKWVSIGLPLPPNTEIAEVSICYQLSDSRSFIAQTRIVEMNTPDRAFVRHDDATALKSTAPDCHSSIVSAFVPIAAVTLLLRLNFQNTNDSIRLGAVAVKVRPTVECVSTMTALRELPAGAAPCITVLGYHAEGDGGGGQFYWDAQSTQSANAGTVITPLSNPAQGRWRRLVEGPLSVRWFGAIGDRTSHHLSEFYGSVGTAQRDYPFVISLTQETDWAAIQAALNAAGPNQAVYIPPGIYFVSNVVVYPEQTLFGAGRDQSILKGAPQSQGKMLTDSGSAVKITLRDFCLDANNQNGYTDILSLGTNGGGLPATLFGTEGYLANLWLRDAPAAVGLDLNANVGYGYNITIQTVREGFHCWGNANIFSILSIGDCKGGDGYHSAFLSGCDIHGMHIEAPASNSVPLYFNRDSSVTGCSISLAKDTVFDHVIGIDKQVQTWQLYHLTYLFGSPVDGIVISGGNIRLKDGTYAGGNASRGSLDGQGSWTNAPPIAL